MRNTFDIKEEKPFQIDWDNLGEGYPILFFFF